ncbi:MAG: muraminidase [Candidatus Eremiobacteraeota bacterium]|nr:muraminidase [Candidatus Eremiobacteraeota bacterium]
MPHTNPAGLSIIRNDEGEILYAYDDESGQYPPPPFMPGMTLKGVLTIGDGHTGPDVHPGQRITPAEAASLLAADLHGFEVAVNNMVAHDINSNQFSALVSLAYNIGSGALQRSSLLAALNAGNVKQAADDFGLYVHGPNGEVMAGLVTRRAQERALFLA